jgi:hypothetical protein
VLAVIIASVIRSSSPDAAPASPADDDDSL